jgi:hypothetical protein
MSRTWTGGRAALPERRPASSRVPLLAAAACATLLLPACRGDEGNPSQVLPIRASIVLPDPEPLGSAVFFRQSVSDTDADDDLVILDVMLRTSASVEFDAFTLEVRFDPGIVNVGGDPMASPFSSTPFGTCSQCLRLCAPPCPTLPCPSATCQVCDGACDPPNTIEKVNQSPLCLVNGADANATGTLLIGVSINQDIGILNPTPTDCASSFTAPADSDLKLLTLGFIAASTGTSTIELITDPNPMSHGDCEILMSFGDLEVPCDDRSATLTGAR